MAKKFDRKGMIKTSSEPRKFAPKDLATSPVATDTTNADHIVAQATGLQVTSGIAEKSAELARQNLQAIRDAMSGKVKISKETSRLQVSSQDVSSAKNFFAAQLTEPLLSEDAKSNSLTSGAVIDLVNVGSNFMFDHRLEVTPGASGRNEATPDLYSVRVDLDKKKGSVDSFYTDLSFRIDKTKLGKVKAVRIFRSTVDTPALVAFRGNISQWAMETLAASSLRTQIKNFESVAVLENRFIEAGIGNSISALNPFSKALNVRTGSTKKTSAGISTAVDLSVSQNYNAMQLLSQSLGNVQGTSSPPEVTRFKEIAFLSLDAGTVAGDFFEGSYEDRTVSYGKGYQYYAVTVDSDLQESVRSRIVSVFVDGLRVPNSPKTVNSTIIENFVSLNSFVEDLLVFKFEIWRKGKSRDPLTPAQMLSSRDGYVSNTAIKNIQDNGFSLIGETLNLGRSGSTFYDRNILPGQVYVYRVYSVDVFGNKSESPFELSVFVPERSHKQNSLHKPNLLAEVDSATGKVKLTFDCDDPRVESFMVARRDLTLNQSAFVPPGQSNILRLGAPRSIISAVSMQGEVLNDHSLDISWTGRLENQFTTASFVDLQTDVDHVYQYRIHGLDRFGNNTPYEISKPLLVSRASVANAPTNVSATLLVGDNQKILGVQLDWDNSNVNFSAEDLVGSQQNLSNSGIRTLFQVSRRKVGESQWKDFPMFPDKTFVDAVGDASTQVGSSRPELLSLNETYIYRVACFLSGGSISNYSPLTEIFVGAPMFPPVNFRLQASDTRANPFYVMLNWDTSDSSGVVDKWEIERVALNNQAASRINSKNISSVDDLDFEPYRTVYRESSRGISENLDSAGARPGNSTIIGQHSYMDSAVILGNTYFYRITAVSPSGDRSDSVLKAIRLTDDSFEKQQKTTVSVLQKQKMTFDPAPVIPTSAPASNSGGLTATHAVVMKPPKYIPVLKTDKTILDNLSPRERNRQALLDRFPGLLEDI